MNFADEALARELRLPVRRWGGNATTRYNWQNDTSNHASDWYFENIPEENPNPAAPRWLLCRRVRRAEPPHRDQDAVDHPDDRVDPQGPRLCLRFQREKVRWDQTVGAGGFDATYPAYSITLIIVPEGR